MPSEEKEREKNIFLFEIGRIFSTNILVCKITNVDFFCVW